MDVKCKFLFYITFDIVSYTCYADETRSCYNYTSVDTTGYTISTTMYNGAFSANESYPDHSLSTLETLSMFTSASNEHKLSGYTLEPDIQRYDSNSNRCDAYTIFYVPNNGTVGSKWVYRFGKHWLYDGVTTGVDYEFTLSPNNGWLTLTDNTTHLHFEGTVTNASHSGVYVLNVIAKLQSDGSQVDSYTSNFTIAGNQPPVVNSMRDVTLTVPKAIIWDNPGTVIEDPENDTLTLTLLVDNVSATWISINPENYAFTGWPSNAIAGAHNITVIVNDGFNDPVNTSFTVTIVANYDPYSVGIYISDVDTGVNEFVSVVFLPVDDLFDDPENSPMTGSVLRFNGDPLPSFLTFNSSNNTMYGTPTK